MSDTFQVDAELEKRTKAEATKIRTYHTSTQTSLVDTYWEMTAIRKMTLEDSQNRRLEKRMLQALMDELLVIRTRVDRA
ncbi:uncharacterized protein LOC111321031 isoform X3 [Stylophora pistillata]|uniref:uncharacterized protein LOC111321031 isoform X3 n=1 Tax=Stylophora pistillata TaxID=50429 RepID=UPI000C03BA13|nr:uncharacterized protein LOC111321031 isoform X3 [Stylophora pistillata]XP_022779539.1 uncharacterized protein LOC111321031 isoform X3 [Stylophora pistillata]